MRLPLLLVLALLTIAPAGVAQAPPRAALPVRDTATLAQRVQDPISYPRERFSVPEHRFARSERRLGGWKGALIGAAIGGALATIPIVIVGERGDSPFDEPVFWVALSVGALGGFLAEW